MKLTRLQLTEYRNYEHLDLALATGPTALIGPNAQGKTNVLEAIHYLAIGRSHRTSTDQALVRSGADAAVIRAEAVTDDGHPIVVSLELRSGKNRAQVNGQPQPRLGDAIGRIRSVLLAPEDLVLVRGDPADRRRFLDDLLAGRRATFQGSRGDLDRALTQRNAILKDARVTGRLARDVLEVWTDTYVNLAAPILAARIAAINALAEPVSDAYADLVADAPTHDVSRLPLLDYVLSWGREVRGRSGQEVPDPQALAQELREALAAREADELRRGMTLVGPHRDDLVLRIGDLPAKGYASHGEQWSLALALKLASHEVIGAVGDSPIVLLDDVFSELDQHRRRRLATRCEQFQQVLVTAPIGTEVPLPGARLQVNGGRIRSSSGVDSAAPSHPANVARDTSSESDTP